VRVVDPNGPSQAWVQALGDDAADAAIAMDAEVFLDDLARATVTAALSRLLQEARELHAAERQPWSQATHEGCQALQVALADSPADAILRWWRDGVTSTLACAPGNSAVPPVIAVFTATKGPGRTVDRGPLKPTPTSRAPR
jgi:hypothetical protein